MMPVRPPDTKDIHSPNKKIPEAQFTFLVT